MDVRVSGTGFTQEVPRGFSRVPEFDPRSGDHLWSVTVLYGVNPAKMMSGDGPTLLDVENLLLASPPGCFYCEEVYTPLLATRRCAGHPR